MNNIKAAVAAIAIVAGISGLAACGSLSCPAFFGQEIL